MQQLCADTGYSFEDLPGAMDDRDGLWTRVREHSGEGINDCNLRNASLFVRIENSGIQLGKT